MSAAFDSNVSVNNEVMSSTLPALVPGIGEASLAAIAFWKFIRSCGSAINLGRSIARRFSITLLGQFGAMRPKRQILAITRLWSDSAFSLGGVRTVTLRTNRLPGIHLPCQYVVKPVLSLSSVRTLKRVRYTTSRCSTVRVEEGEFLIFCVNQ